MGTTQSDQVENLSNDRPNNRHYCLYCQQNVDYHEFTYVHWNIFNGPMENGVPTLIYSCKKRNSLSSQSIARPLDPYVSP